MRIEVLGCAGGSAPGLLLSSYLVDDVLAIDAGALTTGLAVEAQRSVRTVALTHGHLDHVWSLPLFLANRFDDATPTLRLLGSAYTLETVRLHLFNDRIWPDFTRARVGQRPLFETEVVEPDGETRLEHGHALTAVALSHIVPCQAWRIRRDGVSAIVCGDTITTDAVWRLADETPDLAAVLIECSWPDELRTLAERSGHMTPALLGADLEKLRTDVPVHVMHMKPGYEATLRRQLSALGDDRVRFLAQGAKLDLRPRGAA